MRQVILIIDDSEDTRLLVNARLRGEPVELLYANSGDRGMEMARSRLPDLILLDVDMPHPDGFEVCRFLKSDPSTREIPVIFLTGVTSTEQKLKGLELGAIDYVTKPFDPAELRARVKASLRTKQLMDLLSEKAMVLQVSEERFRFLAENSNDIISRHNLDGAFLYVSPACRSVLGYEPDELIGRAAHDFIHEEDVASLEAIFKGDPAQGVSSLAFRARRKEGGYVWLEAASQAVRHRESSAIIEIQMSSRDITLRKRAEALETGRAHVLEMVAENRPFFDILEELVRLVERMYPAALASAVMLTDGRVEHAAPNLPEAFRDALTQQLKSTECEIYDVSHYQNQPVRCSHMDSDRLWDELRSEIADHDLRTCWSILLRSGTGAVRGLFSVYHQHPLEPDRSAIELLDMVGRLITIASEHRDLSAQLAYQAHHDWLTGLPNRQLFEDRLNHGLSRAVRNKQMLGLLCIDLDRFKHINDTLGHHAGDSALVEFTRRIKSVLRDSDTLARIGGDEFTLLIPDLKDRSHALHVARKLVEALEPAFQIAGSELYMTSSIGIAVYPHDAEDAPSLQKNADLALYRAKALGRNRYQYFSSDMLSAGVGRLGMESHLRRAVEKQELELHYQPQFDAAGLLTGMEALVRWRHPKFGVVSPGVFIPLAEESGLILEIGEWVLDEACRQNKAWQEAGYHPIKIAANVSALQFAQPDFAETVVRALRKHDLDARWLEVELTETFLMKNMIDTARKLAAIRAAGVKVALDDFGTGYSSLAYLQSLPIDTLKIDQSFVQQIEPGAGQVNTTAVIRAIVSLGHSLGMTVMAEGVELAHQLEFLRRTGCDAMQGFLLGMPRPASGGVEYLASANRRRSA
jgi:diguanylate cyclase (GGDEF)-like protein/PAS domain S-box-containing protein